MDRNTIPESTILQRKKKNVKISDQETLMLLRTYIVHPCSWDNIIKSIKENSHTLPKEAQELYNTSSRRQLKDRLCTKLGKLMVVQPEKIKNNEIRDELVLVRQLEKKHVDAKKKIETLVPNQPDNDDDKATPSTSQCDALRDEAACVLSSDDEELGTSSSKRKADISVSTASGQPTKKSKHQKRTPVMELVRENQIAYSKFITKKVPKLLRALGVSSSSDSE